MGISALVGLKATVLFTGFIYLRNSTMRWVSIPLLHASLVSLLVAITSHPCVNLPLLLGKRADGRFPLWSLLVFWPYLGFIRIFVFMRRMMMGIMIGEPLYTEIADGLYVGGWPSSFECLPPGDPAVIDCTCELPRTPAISRNAYLCVATWDTRAPQPSAIESAVQWASRMRAQKRPVYIHCAFGHGRSVCVMCAVLVAVGVAEDWKEAERIIREKRPSIQMNSLHRKNLEDWSKDRISAIRRGELDGSSMNTSSTSNQ